MADTSSTSSMERLVAKLGRLPGIGKRSAERIAFYLLKQPREEAVELAGAIRDLKQNVRHCSQCFNLTDSDPCSICGDPRRDQKVVLVVEQPSDVVTFETTGMYKGVYHVLMGTIAPLDGVNPGELNIDSLIRRVKENKVTEVILGTSPSLEGDGTAMYLAEELAKLKVQVTRLARGLPTGSTLELASKAVLADAIEGRRSMD